jgi:hypothetical protein
MHGDLPFGGHPWADPVRRDRVGLRNLSAKKTIVILGTARRDSNSLAAVEELCPYSSYELIDLRKLKIALYS